jgi:RNA polymerase sigma-70 factor (ECF subfamily)
MLQDRALLRKVKSGRKDALRLIYERYERDLLTLAANLLGEASTAEDVVQDVFVSFVRSVQKFHLRGSLKGYLITCVANRSRDLLRKKKRQRTINIDEAEQAE